jgi:hypothetical protein
VGVHERTAPPVPENHALVGQLRERPCHGRSTDPIPIAELVLGRKPLFAVVPAAEDLFEEERLQLEVERDR